MEYSSHRKISVIIVRDFVESTSQTQRNMYRYFEFDNNDEGLIDKSVRTGYNWIRTNEGERN